MTQHRETESLNALLRSLAQSLQRLTQQETDLTELDRALELSRELHERMAILRYRVIDEWEEEPGNQGTREPENQGSREAGNEGREEPDHQGTRQPGNEGREEPGNEGTARGFDRPFLFSFGAASPTSKIASEAKSEDDDASTAVAEKPAVLQEDAVAEEQPLSTVDATPSNDDVMSLAERLQLAPLKRLTDAMGINDRVRFASDLFESDMSAFLAGCKQIEDCQTASEAILLAKSLAEEGIDWSVEKGSPHDFLMLVTRLFLADSGR